MSVRSRIYRERRLPAERPLAAVIAGLWRNNEQGVWYDAGDLSTMYQDAAGTLPVYAPGQGQVDPPVGLWLDKRLGFALGPERITNTEFQTLNGWTAVRGASATVSGGAVTVTTANPQDWGSVSTPIATEPGKSYLVKVLMTSGNGQNVQLLVSESAVNHVSITNTGSSRNAVGCYSLVFKATKTVHYVWLGSSTNTASVGVSSWATPSVREISANYAYQATTTSRPTLSARYNLLTNTPFAGAIAGAPGTAPTGWVFSFTTGGISAVTPLGPDFAIQIATSSSRLVFTQQLTAAPNVAYSHWIDVLETTAIAAINFIGLTSPPSGATMTYWFNGEPITSSTVISSPGRLEMRMLVGSTGGNYYVRFGVGCSGNTTGVATIARPDVRVTNDGVGLPPYQRVVDPNTYDTVFFPPYLRFDGVDDWLRTSDIDFSGVTALFVAAAARKLSDAARGTLCELSSSYSNPGSFALEAPGITLNSFMFAHTGATTYKTLYRQLPAPVSAVVVGVSDLPSGYVRLSAKSPGYAQMSDVTTDVGGGSYATASLFIGRRAGSSQPFNGRLYSLYIRGGSPTVAQLSAVERHLNQKARIY